MCDCSIRVTAVLEYLESAYKRCVLAQKGVFIVVLIDRDHAPFKLAVFVTTHLQVGRLI